MKRAALGVAAAAIGLSGCVSTGTTQKAVGAKWVGQSLDSFVVANGPPTAPYTLSDGRRIVEWQESFGVPGAGPLLVAASGASTEAGSLKLNCRLRLTVSKAGVIEDVTVANDTIGMWTLSRCAEVLKS